MKLIYIAMLALAGFIAIWIFVVVPSERKHHERKLESLRKRIEKRETAAPQDSKYAALDSDDDSRQVE
jgi:hypothetical protein